MKWQISKGYNICDTSNNVGHSYCCCCRCNSSIHLPSNPSCLIPLSNLEGVGLPTLFSWSFSLLHINSFSREFTTCRIEIIFQCVLAKVNSPHTHTHTHRQTPTNRRTHIHFYGLVYFKKSCCCVNLSYPTFGKQFLDAFRVHLGLQTHTLSLILYKQTRTNAFARTTRHFPFNSWKQSASLGMATCCCHRDGLIPKLTCIYNDYYNRIILR
jgi:hypothetical protein